MRQTLLLLLVVLIIPRCAIAESGAGAAEHAEIVFVPELHGAVSAQGYLSQSFGVADDNIEAFPSSMAGVAVGYRHFFDVHGALNLLTRLRYARSTAGRDEDGSAWEPGGDAGLFVRGYSNTFAYLGAGVIAGADVLSWDRLPGALAERYTKGEDHALGMSLAAGLETHIGMVWYLATYLFGEIGAEMTLEHVRVGGVVATGVSGRWVLRIEWGVRAGSPGGEDPNTLYREL